MSNKSIYVCVISLRSIENLYPLAEVIITKMIYPRIREYLEYLQSWIWGEIVIAFIPVEITVNLV